VKLVAVLVSLAGIFVMAPAAAGDNLRIKDILVHLEGVWGWPEKGDAADDYSCKRNPMRIWFEKDGTIFKSIYINEKGDVALVSKVGIPPGTNENTAYILISYLNHEQLDSKGKQVVWALTMPNKDSFAWRAVPGGLPVRPLERCQTPKVG
jgi:hypothetical protein